MIRKTIWLAALLGGCMLPGLAQAQFYPPPKSRTQPPTVSYEKPFILSGSSGEKPAPEMNKSYVTQENVVETPVITSELPGGCCNDNDRFRNWETHPRAFCSGCPSSKPTIQTELYVRMGPSFIIGGGTYGHSLETGVTFQGGAKAMFFNQFFDAAWYVDLSISNSQNSANSHPATVSLIVDDVATLATIRGLNRTFANVGLGRAWYLWAPATADGCNLRFCLDGGGRYGTARGDFFEITHETDVIGGVYTGFQTDLEFPMGRCTCHLGLRLEYGYTWSDMFQRKSDVQDLNLLLQTGIRY